MRRGKQYVKKVSGILGVKRENKKDAENQLDYLPQ